MDFKIMAADDEAVLAEFGTEISDEINANVQITNIASDNKSLN